MWGHGKQAMRLCNPASFTVHSLIPECRMQCDQPSSHFCRHVFPATATVSLWSPKPEKAPFPLRAFLGLFYHSNEKVTERGLEPHAGRGIEFGKNSHDLKISHAVRMDLDRLPWAQLMCGGPPGCYFTAVHASPLISLCLLCSLCS